jgi:hypothetical protein
MKKIFIIAVIAAFVSCSSDDNLSSNDLNNKILMEQINLKTEYLVAQKIGDSLPGDDTGGQGGTNPIKP